MTYPRPNLRTLDMLRGMLAVYVLLGHCRWLLWTGHSAWMAAPHAAWLEPLVFASASVRYGHEAVMIFFVLSGFFIHLRAAQASPLASRVSASDFYWRRVHRLGAPYAFALAVTVVLDAIGRSMWPALYAATTGDPLTDAIFSHTGYQWQSVVPAIVVLPSSLGYDFGTNGPLWSLAYEVVYYAMYPAWCALRRSSMVLAYVALPVACVMVALLPAPPFVASVVHHYPVWLTGAAIAELLSRDRLRVPLFIPVVLFAGGLALHEWPAGLAQFPVVPAIVFGGAAVVACANMSETAMRHWPVRAFEYLGMRSYSIYIMHFPLVALMSAPLFAMGGRPMHGWFAVGGAIVAVAFGCLCFAICERHFVHHRAPGLKAAV